MHQGSPTREFDTSRHDDSTCPDWCETTAEQHLTDESGSHLHKGPQIGPFRVWRSDGDELGDTVDLEEPSRDYGPDALRKLAADALSAAEWLEARR